MRVLIIGGTGMLGHKLVQEFRGRFETWAAIRTSYKAVEELEIFDEARTLEHVDATDFDSLRRCVESARPDVVVNAVGVIKQLPTAKDVIATLTINSIFPQRLAQLSADLGFRLICISTDCVFLGDKGNYTENDAPDALDLYGRSKHFGEVSGDNCLTLRTSIIGREIGTSHSLVEWFLSNRGGSVRGFVNAIYSGFPTILLADIIGGLIADHPKLNGLYHISSAAINKYELLSMIRDAYRVEIEIDAFEDLRIDRSLNSERFSESTGFSAPPWTTMIERMAEDPTPYEQWRKIRS
jgi:dTDP-4-dehydrorhamnose reductase